MIKGALIVIIAALIGVIIGEFITKKVILPFIEWICDLLF